MKMDSDHKFYAPIVIFGVIIIISFLFLYNHKKIECEKMEDYFIVNVLGKLIIIGVIND